MPLRIVFTDRQTDVRVVDLPDEAIAVIGRAADADISFPNLVALSRLHCELRLQGERACIRPLHCRGPIRVGETAIRDEQELKVGDVVNLLGEFGFRLEQAPGNAMRGREVLKFFGAVERDPAIERWFGTRPDELGSIARTWFTRMRDCGADVRELLHDGYPTVCVQDAPFAYVGAFRAHVNVGFFHGVGLPDPANLLEGTGKYMRHVKVKHGQGINQSALESLIAAAYDDIAVRLMAAE